MCLSSLLLKNTDLRYGRENDEYSSWDGDDLGLILSAGRFRSGIKETLAVTGTMMNNEGFGGGTGHVAFKHTDNYQGCSRRGDADLG